MKKVFALAAVVVMLLSSCADHRADNLEGLSLASAISVDDCYLCSSRTDTVISRYWGQDNVGLIDVNTFEVVPFIVNSYDDFGNMLTEATGAFLSGGGYLGDEKISVYTVVDRGYADVRFDISGAVVDSAAIAQYLCQNCIDDFIVWHSSTDELYSFAVVNFLSREIISLKKTQPWFATDNYLVDCDFEDTGDVELFVVYRPVRYHEDEN